MVIDWHCHLLPSLDDGPVNMEESLAMVRLLHGAGYRTICCTPHMIEGNFEADNATVRRVAAVLQQELERAEIPLRLLVGREYYLDEQIERQMASLLPIGGTRFVLMEIPFRADAGFVLETCGRIIANGYVPLIAHPERCRLLQNLPSAVNDAGVWGRFFNSLRKSKSAAEAEIPLLQSLREIGCRFQGNVGSLAGFYGEPIKQQATVFLEQGLYDCFGSDGHRAVYLEEILSRGVPQLDRLAAVSSG